MRIGETATAFTSFGEADVEAYVALGGARPGPGLAAEALVGAVFSRLLGTRLPGPGANYLKQDTRYLALARLQEPLRFDVEVTRLRPEKSLVDLRTTCTGAAGRIIAEGRALIYVGDPPAPPSPTDTKLHEETCP